MQEYSDVALSIPTSVEVHYTFNVCMCYIMWAMQVATVSISAYLFPYLLPVLRTSNPLLESV